MKRHSRILTYITGVQGERLEPSRRNSRRGGVFALILSLTLLGGTGCGPDGEDPFADFFQFQILSGLMDSGPDVPSPEPVPETDFSCGNYARFSLGQLPYLVQPGQTFSVDVNVTDCGRLKQEVDLKFSTNRFGPTFGTPTVVKYEVPREVGSYSVSITVPADLAQGTAHRLWAYRAIQSPDPSSANETAIPQTTSCTTAPGYKIEPVPTYAVRGTSFDYKITVYRCGTSSRSTSVHLSSSNSFLSYSSSSRVGNVVIPAATGTYNFTGTVPTAFTDGNSYYLGEYIDDVFSGNRAQYIVADATCTAPCSLTVNWDALREKAVNSTGGFYRVYYGSDENSTDVYKDVPYVSGPTAPTSTNLTLPSGGLRFIRVKGVSAFNPAGGEEAASIKVFAF